MMKEGEALTVTISDAPGDGSDWERAPEDSFGPGGGGGADGGAVGEVEPGAGGVDDGEAFLDVIAAKWGLIRRVYRTRSAWRRTVRWRRRRD